jgi:hypothetical protein
MYICTKEEIHINEKKIANRRGDLTSQLKSDIMYKVVRATKQDVASHIKWWSKWIKNNWIDDEGTDWVLYLLDYERWDRKKSIGIIHNRNETKGLTNCCRHNYAKKYYFHVYTERIMCSYRITYT